MQAMSYIISFQLTRRLFSVSAPCSNDQTISDDPVPVIIDERPAAVVEATVVEATAVPTSSTSQPSVVGR